MTLPNWLKSSFRRFGKDQAGFHSPVSPIYGLRTGAYPNVAIVMAPSRIAHFLLLPGQCSWSGLAVDSKFANTCW